MNTEYDSEVTLIKDERDKAIARLRQAEELMQKIMSLHIFKTLQSPSVNKDLLEIEVLILKYFSNQNNREINTEQMKDGKNVIIRLKGQTGSFHCNCGCNVFCELGENKYECNSCRTLFSAED